MANELELLTANLQNYIVAPLNAFGLGGFVFDIEGEATTVLSAEITDHYTESNRAGQDHIARKPKQITLKGYVGELVYRIDDSNSGFLQTAVQKLTELSDYLPKLSAAATQLQDVAGNTSISFSEGISDAADIFGLVKDTIGSFGDSANQQKAYAYFKALWEEGVLMGVQTPWEFLTNMGIERVVAIQDEKTKFVTDFAVTLKQIRFSQTTSAAYSPPTATTNSDASVPAISNFPPVVPVETKSLDGVAAIQAPNPVPIGNVQGVALPSNSLPGWQSQIGNVGDILSNPGAMSVFSKAVAPAH